MLKGNLLIWEFCQNLQFYILNRVFSKAPVTNFVAGTLIFQSRLPLVGSFQSIRFFRRASLSCAVTLRKFSPEKRMGAHISNSRS